MIESFSRSVCYSIWVFLLFVPPLKGIKFIIFVSILIVWTNLYFLYVLNCSYHHVCYHSLGDILPLLDYNKKPKTNLSELQAVSLVSKIWGGDLWIVQWVNVGCMILVFFQSWLRWPVVQYILSAGKMSVPIRSSLVVLEYLSLSSVCLTDVLTWVCPFRCGLNFSSVIIESEISLNPSVLFP